MKLTPEETTKIENAVKSFNTSPWIIEGDEYNLKETLERAKEQGSEIILKKIRRADINAFHAEEGRCGNI